MFLGVCFCVFLRIVFFAGSARHEPLSNATKMPSLQQVFSSRPADGRSSALLFATGLPARQPASLAEQRRQWRLLPGPSRRGARAGLAKAPSGLLAQTPRPHHRHQGLQLSDEGPGYPIKPGMRNSGLSHPHDRLFKPAVLRHFRAAAHTTLTRLRRGRSTVPRSFPKRNPRSCRWSGTVAATQAHRKASATCARQWRGRPPNNRRT